MDKSEIKLDEKYIQVIRQETDFVQYIKLLADLKNCIIVLAVKDTVGFNVQLDGYEALKRMGLSKLNSNDKTSNHWKGYVAIVEDGKIIFEKIGKINEPVLFKRIKNGIALDVISAPRYGGNIASVLINGKEYSTNRRGFNIVSISDDGKVRDSVAFDTHLINRICIRKARVRDLMVIPEDRENLFNRNLNDTIKRLDVKYILNGWQDKTASKIKVRFMFFGWYILWTAIESLVESFEEDYRYDVLIIIVTDHKKTWDVISKDHSNIVSENDYNLEKDCPNVIISNSSNYTITKTKSTLLAAYVGVSLNNGAVMGFASEKSMSSQEKRINADLYFVEKYLAKKSNWYGVGNPKFDIIYRNVSRVSEIPKTWEKIKGKAIILWAPDHNWVQKDLTFDLYARPFFDYFKKNKDMALIIRMHPCYPSELIRVGIWSKEDFQLFIKYINSFPNIIWDDRKDYGLAYSIADAVVTDINCGITISALPLDVPIAVMLRYDGEICRPNYPDVIDALYQIHNVEEAYSFFDNVKNKKDPLQEKRSIIRDHYVANFDGKNGTRIKKIIEDKYFNSLSERIRDNNSHLINSLMEHMPKASVALFLGNNASREVYLAISRKNTDRVVCVIDKSVNCVCADLGLPIISLDKIREYGVQNILVTTRSLYKDLNDFLMNQGKDIHVFGLYGWFEVNGYHTKYNFYDFAIQSVDEPLPSYTTIQNFLHYTSPNGFCEIAVVMIVNDEKILLHRLHDILKQIALGIRIYCLDFTGKAADIVKEYQKIDSSLEVITIDGYSSLPSKINELISSVNSKYLFFLAADEYLHAKGLFYLHEIAEQTEADVAAAGAVLKAEKKVGPSLADFAEGAFELKKEARVLPATFKERSAELNEAEIPDFAGNKLYRVDFLRKYGIRFKDIKSGWKDIFCLQTIFGAPKYVKVASPVCISSGNAAGFVSEDNSAEYAKKLVESMFAYQQSIEAMLKQWRGFGNNPSLCNEFRERAMTIFDQQYFSGMTLDDEMRKAVSQAVQEELQKNPSIGMWWIKYLFMRSSFPQNV